MPEPEESTIAQTIKNRMAALQKELLANREKGAQAQTILNECKANELRFNGAQEALQNMLKEIEN